jgi:hypothetical protein
VNVGLLVPKPIKSEPFRRSQEKFVPDVAGCYVLTTFTGEVLYVGLSINLRRRMNEHLDNLVKTGLTDKGRAMFFYWIESEDTNRIERTWMNIHIQNEGVIPILNKVYSPI